MEAASSWIESGSLNLNLRTRPNPITQISKIAFCSSFRNVKERKKKKKNIQNGSLVGIYTRKPVLKGL